MTASSFVPGRTVGWDPMLERQTVHSHTDWVQGTWYLDEAQRREQQDHGVWRSGQDVLLLLRPPTPKTDNAPYLTPHRTHAGMHDKDRSRHRLDKHERGVADTTPRQVFPDAVIRLSVSRCVGAARASYRAMQASRQAPSRAQSRAHHRYHFRSSAAPVEEQPESLAV